MLKQNSWFIGGFIMAFGVIGFAWAIGPTTGCVQVESNPDFDAAQFVLEIDPADASCKTQGQVGCRIYGGNGSCSATDPITGRIFTATSRSLSDGSLSWTLEGDLNADAVFVVSKLNLLRRNSNSKTQACSYVYSDEARSGKGLGYKSNGNFANVDYIEICSDGVDSPVSTPLPGCPEAIQAALDGGDFGDYAIIGQISDAKMLTLCIKNDPDITVLECINEGEDVAVNSGLPFCNEGPDMDGDGRPDGAQPMMRNTTVATQNVGTNSCVYTCLPPPLTFGGRSQCAYVCN